MDARVCGQGRAGARLELERGGEGRVGGGAELREADLGPPHDDEGGVDVAHDAEDDGTRRGEEADDARHRLAPLHDLDLELADVRVVPEAQLLQLVHVLFDVERPRLLDQHVVVLLVVDLALLLRVEVLAGAVLDADDEGDLEQEALELVVELERDGPRLLAVDEPEEEEVEGGRHEHRDDRVDVESVPGAARVGGGGQQVLFLVGVQEAGLGELDHLLVDGLSDVLGGIDRGPGAGLVAAVAGAERVLDRELELVLQQRLAHNLEGVAALLGVLALDLKVGQYVRVRHDEGGHVLALEGLGGVLERVELARLEAVDGRELPGVGLGEDADVEAKDLVDVLDVGRLLHLAQLGDDLTPEEAEADEAEEHPEGAEEAAKAGEADLVAVADGGDCDHGEP
mmetsp:Transcript_16441/g.41555  ORF Transcript_16441/g.41555 Transcript_16441/m.41555 type:complete len:398 (+) Transcript_16441:207-1400(+)